MTDDVSKARVEAEEPGVSALEPEPAFLEPRVSGTFEIPEDVQLHAVEEVTPVPASPLEAALPEGLGEQQSGAEPPSDEERATEPISDDRIDALREELLSRHKGWLGLLDQQRRDRLDEFALALTQASALLDRYSSQDEHDVERRKAALDAFFELDGLLRAYEENLERVDEAAKQAAARQVKKQGRSTVAIAPVGFELPAGGASYAKPVALGSLVALVVGLAIWRLVAFYGGPDLDPSLAATQHVTPHEGSTGVDTQGKSVAVHEDLEAGLPVITHVRLSQDAKGNMRAYATAISAGGPKPTLSFAWYEGDSPVTEEAHGLLEAALVQPGKGYAVQVVASDGAKKSRPVRTKELVALDKAK